MDTYQNELIPNQSKDDLSLKQRTKKNISFNVSEQISNERVSTESEKNVEVPPKKQSSGFILIDYLNSIPLLLLSAIVKSCSLFAGQKFALILKSFYFFINFFFYYYFLSFTINGYIQYFIIAAIGLFCLLLYLINSEFIKLSSGGKWFVSEVEAILVGLIAFSFYAYYSIMYLLFSIRMDVVDASKKFIFLHETSFIILICIFFILCKKFKINKKILLYVANAIAFIYIISLFGLCHIKTFSILTIFHMVLLMTKFAFVSAYIFYNDSNSSKEFSKGKLSIFLCCVFMFMAFNWRIFSVLEDFNGCYSKDLII